MGSRATDRGAAGLSRAAHRQAHLERANEPLGVVTAIAGQARGVRCSRDVPSRGTEPRWTHERTRSSKRRRSSFTCVSGTRGNVATVGRSMCSRIEQRRAAEGHGLGRRSDLRRQLLDSLIEDIGFECGGGPTRCRWAMPSGPCYPEPELVSGAGHDAMIRSEQLAAVRRSLNGGVSHHPTSSRARGHRARRRCLTAAR